MKNNNSDIIKCLTCKGKGWLLKKSNLVPLFGWVYNFLSMAESQSFATKECNRCNSSGFIKVEVK